jgi:DUF1365 family protein
MSVDTEVAPRLRLRVPEAEMSPRVVSRSTVNEMRTPTSTLVRGELLHARADRHAHRTFRYPVYVAALELAELPALDERLRLFSVDRRNLLSFHTADYRTQLGGLDALRAANDLPVAATTTLVTNPRVLGYTFNPVSFFLGYAADGALTSAIAEVNNTYGGNFRYLLGPRDRLPDRGARVGFRHVRELFVSPFLHGPATYEFWFDAARGGDHLAIEMTVEQAGHRTFTARLTGTRAPLTDRALLAAAVRYPLMTAQVIALIHFEAIKLHALGVPYRPAPPDHRPLPTVPS